MTTTDQVVDLTTPTLPLALVRQHPRNARRSAVADDEMVDSIRAIGIAQAVTVVPAYDGWDGWYALGGNRRLDGAAKAGLAEIPVMLRDDLVTESQQLEFMLIENLLRREFSKAEEASAYQQLTFFGHDIDAIAAATGRAKATIKARLRLTDLPPEAFEQLHDGQMTLGDAEAMLEFADDPDASDRLLQALGTGNFASRVHELRNTRERAARHRELIDEFEAAGATQIVREAGGPWDRNGHYPLTWFRGASEDLQDRSSHDGCLGYYYAGPESYSDPLLVCSDGERHPVPVDPAAVERDQLRAEQDAQYERDRIARDARAARRTASSAARLEWLTGHFTAMFPVKSHRSLADATKAVLPMLLTDDRETVPGASILAAAGVAVPDRSHTAVTALLAAEADKIPTSTATKVLSRFAAYLAAATTEQLDTEPAFLDDAAHALRVLNLWDWLKAAGYALSDTDKEIRTELEVRHTDLAAEDASDEDDA